jgi:hypothetical protein
VRHASVHIVDNELLCYAKSVAWWRITDPDTLAPIIADTYDQCMDVCDGSNCAVLTDDQQACWSARHCQLGWVV